MRGSVRVTADHCKTARRGGAARSRWIRRRTWRWPAPCRPPWRWSGGVVVATMPVSGVDAAGRGGTVPAVNEFVVGAERRGVDGRRLVAGVAVGVVARGRGRRHRGGRLGVGGRRRVGGGRGLRRGGRRARAWWSGAAWSWSPVGWSSARSAATCWPARSAPADAWWTAAWSVVVVGASWWGPRSSRGTVVDGRVVAGSVAGGSVVAPAVDSVTGPTAAVLVAVGAVVLVDVDELVALVGHAGTAIVVVLVDGAASTSSRRQSGRRQRAGRQRQQRRARDAPGPMASGGDEHDGAAQRDQRAEHEGRPDGPTGRRQVTELVHRSGEGSPADADATRRRRGPPGGLSRVWR